MRRPLALLGLLLALAACSSAETKRATHLERADAYLAEGKQPEALVELKNALAQAPEDPEINFRLAQVSVALRDGRNALYYYRETRRLDRRWIDAYLGEARLLRRADPDEAVKVAAAAIDVQPGNAPAHQLQAELLAAKGELDAALAAARRAVELAPDDPSSQLALGRVHMFRIAEALRDKSSPASDCEAALAAFEAAEQQAGERERWRPLAQRARVLAACPERTDEAAEVFRAAVAAAETSGATAVVPAARAALAYARRTRNAELRRWALERTLAADPGQLGAWIELAALDEQTGGSAEAVYRRLLEARPDDAEARLAFAQYLVAADRAQDAAAELEIGAARGVEPTRLLAALVDLQYSTGEASTAASLVERMEREHPDDPHTALARAGRMLNEGRLEEAVTVLRAAVGAHESAHAQHLLAVAHLRRGELSEAAAAVDRAVELAPRDASQRSLRARVKASAQDWPAVIGDLSWVALRTRRLARQERLLLARAYYETDRPDHGLRALEPLVAEPEPFVPALLELVRREGARDPARARGALQRAHELEPSHPEVLVRLAAVDLAEGNRERALARLDGAVARAPQSVDARLTRAQVLVAEGRLPAATADARAAFELAPQRPDAAMLLVQLLGSQGQEQAALAALEAQQAAGRLSPPVQVLLARLNRKLGQDARAIELLELAVAARADLALAKNDLAYLLALRGEQLERAQQLATDALSALPEEPRVLDTLGYVHLRRRQADLAVTRLEEAVARAERAGQPSATYHYHLGLALRALDRNSSAAQAFERALALDPVFPEAAKARREREAALAGAPPPADLF